MILEQVEVQEHQVQVEHLVQVVVQEQVVHLEQVDHLVVQEHQEQRVEKLIRGKELG